MARIAAGPLVQPVRQVQVLRLVHVDRLLVALRTGSLGHVRGQHRVVPQMRNLPAVLLLPGVHLRFVLRGVRRVDEADRLSHALVADRAAGRGERMRRRAADVGVQVRMRRVRLRIRLVPLAVDRDVARAAAIHLLEPDEVQLVVDVRRDRLLDRQARGHEVEQRGVQQIVSDEVDLQVLDERGQPGRLRRQLADLVVRVGDAAGVFADLRAQVVTLRHQPLDLQAELDPAVVHGVDLRPHLLGFVRMFLPELLVGVARDVVVRLLEVELLVREVVVGLDAGQGALELGHLLGIGGELAPRPPRAPRSAPAGAPGRCPPGPPGDSGR